MNTALTVFYYKETEKTISEYARELLPAHPELDAIAVWNPAFDGKNLQGSASGIPVLGQELLAQLCLGNVFRRSAVVLRPVFLEHLPADEHQLWFSLCRNKRLGLMIIPPAHCFGNINDERLVSPRRIEFIRDYCLEDAEALEIVERALSLMPEDANLGKFYFAFLHNLDREIQLRHRESSQYLRCLQAGSGKVEAANELAEYFQDNGKPFLAALLNLYSLTQEPNQIEPYKHFKEIWLGGKFDPLKPKLNSLNEVMVSVLLCTYNRPERLGQALESVLSQTYKDFEVIVVNDGGDSAAEEIVKRYNSDKIRYFYGEHGGHRAALNIGLKVARGKYIAYLDDDDVYYPHHLETLVQFAERDSLDFVCSKSRWIQGHWNEDQWIEDCDLSQKDNGFQMKRMRISAYVTDNTILHRRAIIEKVGLFWEEPQRGGEWEYWVRCSRYYQIRRIESVTCEYRVLTASLPIGQPARARLFTELWRVYFGSEFGYAVLAVSAYYVKDHEVFQMALKYLSKNCVYLKSEMYDELWNICIREGSPIAKKFLTRMARNDAVTFVQNFIGQPNQFWENILRVPLMAYIYLLRYVVSHPRYSLTRIPFFRAR